MLYKIFNADSHSQKYRYEVGVDNLKIVLPFLPFKELEEEKGGKKEDMMAVIVHIFLRKGEGKWRTKSVRLT